ncbi:hypothetical protein GCM10027570_13970 [Streptomonospora sediminis]
MKASAFRILSVFLISATALVYNTIPASAFEGAGGSASASPSQAAVERIAAANGTLDAAEKVDGEEAVSYVDKARDEVSATGTHLSTQESESAQFSDARVSRLDDGTTLVVFPLTGGDLTSSALTVAFDTTGAASGVYEMLLREMSATSGSVEYWVNGAKVLDRVVEADQATTLGWSEFNDCLSNAGVAAWTITAISIACAAICAGTAGAGCVPCIAAAAGGTGGVIGYCINESW